MRRWGFVLVLLLCLQTSCFGFDLVRREVVQISGSDSVELVCEVGADVDSCNFYMPSGKLVCSDEDGFCDSSGITKSIETPEWNTVCKVRLDNPSAHLGDWRCVLEDWLGETAEGVISLDPKIGTSATYSVEMRSVWGDLVIKVGDEIELFCDAFTDDEGSAVSSPGIFVWKVNGEEVARETSQYDEEEEAWTSKAKFTGELDTREISCHLVTSDGRATEVNKDSVAVTPVLFEDMSGGELHPACTEKECTMRVRFRANLNNPEEEEVGFLVGEGDGKSFGLNLGQTANGFEFRDLKSKGFKHQATLAASPPERVLGPNTSRTITLTFKDHRQEYQVKPHQATEKPQATSPESPIKEEEEVEAPTTEAASVGKAGVSLYIVVAIIVLVVGLCGCFYFCKCWRRKDEDQQADTVDPEVGQVTHLDRNQEAANKEKQDSKMMQERRMPPPSGGGGGDNATSRAAAAVKSTETTKPEATAEELAKLLPDHCESRESDEKSSSLASDRSNEQDDEKPSVAPAAAAAAAAPMSPLCGAKLPSKSAAAAAAKRKQDSTASTSEDDDSSSIGGGGGGGNRHKVNHPAQRPPTEQHPEVESKPKKDPEEIIEPSQRMSKSSSDRGSSMDEELDQIVQGLDQTDFGPGSAAGGAATTVADDGRPSSKEKEWMKSPIYKRSLEKANLEKNSSVDSAKAEK